MLLRGVDATPPEGALRASYAPAPEPSVRESEITNPKETALLIIDAQNYNCTRAGALWSDGDGDDASGGGGKKRSSAEELEYFFARLQGSDGGDNPGVIRNWVALAAAARAAGARVVFTGAESFVFEGEGRKKRKKGKENSHDFETTTRKKKTRTKKVMSDATGEASHAERVTSLDYRISGFRIPPRSWDAELLEELKGDEGGNNSLFLPKTSCNVFLSTALDFHLRSLGVKRLVACGVVTDQCVATAVATAADLGFLVTLAEDACAATSAERHAGALRTLRGFARVRSTREVVAELERAAAAGV